MRRYTERVQVRLEAEQLNRLDREAKKRGMSVSALVREAIRDMWALNERRRLAVERIASMNLPVGEWDEIEADILRSYLREDCRIDE